MSATTGTPTHHATATDLTAVVEVIQQLLGQPWLGLRPDLQVHTGVADNSGSTRWYLEDPLTADRFALGVTEHRLVTALAAKPNLLQALHWHQQQFGHLPSAVDLANILKNFIQENLAVRPADAAPPPPPAQPPIWRRVYALRIPMVRPDHALNVSYPWVAWLGHRWLRWLWLFCGLLGCALILPQGDRFLATTGYLFTAQGVISVMIILVLLKIGHECCHAFVAKHYGLHVRSMGIVMILFWPILYTDTTDAWRLTSRRQRLHIALAGIAFELSVAAIALLAWSILPPGLPQNLAFLIAFTSVIGTLAINANPFMRFDGYYALMDLWGVDNLQPRALALTQHYWRRLAVDWQGPMPEEHPQERRLVLYGLGVWIYRLILTAFIALAAYTLINPYVGIALFLLVLSGMLILPTITELTTLLQARKQWGKTRRVALSALLLGGLLAAVLIPLPYAQTAPSLLAPAEYLRLQTAEPGQLVSKVPTVGQTIQSGQIVLRLRNPELSQDIRDADFQLRRVTAQRDALTGQGTEGGYRNWLMAEQQRLLASRSTAQQTNAALNLSSTIDGQVRYVLNDLTMGDWVPADTVLVEISNPESALLRVYLSDDQLRNIPNQASLPKTLEFTCPGLELEATAQATGLNLQPVAEFLNPAWYDASGGTVATRRTESGTHRPRDTWYAADYTVALDPQNQAPLPLGQPCQATLTSDYRSLLGRLINGIAKQLSADGIM